MTPTWSEAYNAFYSGGSVPLMVSFGTDPAYSTCTGGNDTIRTLTHHASDGQLWAWAMVEGLAVLNSTHNLSFAQDFVNYFFTPDLQSNLWDGQFMVPTLAQTENQTEPACYLASPVTLPRMVNLFNAPFFAQGTVQANFARWKSTWSSMYQAARPTSHASMQTHTAWATALCAVLAVVVLVV